MSSIFLRGVGEQSVKEEKSLESEIFAHFSFQNIIKTFIEEILKVKCLLVFFQNNIKTIFGYRLLKNREFCLQNGLFVHFFFLSYRLGEAIIHDLILYRSLNRVE